MIEYKEHNDRFTEKKINRNHRVQYNEYIGPSFLQVLKVASCQTILVKSLAIRGLN